MVTVTSVELQKHFGPVREKALREPVTVTHHGRDSLVILSVEEFRRLQSLDTRRAFFAHELPDEIVAELDKGYQGEPTPHLDHLLK